MATVTPPTHGPTQGAKSYDAPTKFLPHSEGLIGGNYDLSNIGDKIADVAVQDYPTPKAWWVFFLIGFTLLQGMVVAIAYLLYLGVGIWGLNQPVAWGFAIVNFVWWIGIATPHADLGDSAALAPEVADEPEPLRRGDDDLCRHVRGPLSAAAHWAGRGSSTGSSRCR